MVLTINNITKNFYYILKLVCPYMLGLVDYWDQGESEYSECRNWEQ